MVYVGVALFAIYYFRKYLISPWATYISHSRTEITNRVIVYLTVKHTRWYSPFLNFEHIYHINLNSWSEEKTGYIPSDSKQRKLNAIYCAARDREIETEKLSKI